MNGPHLRNMQIQDLIYENEELRIKLGGFDELRLCNNQLIRKLEISKEKQIQLVSQKEILKEKLYELERDLQHNKNSHSEQMRYVLTQHDRLFIEKDTQIDKLQNQLQKSKKIISNLQSDIRVQIENGRELTARQDANLQRYERQFMNCQRQIKDLSRQLHYEKNQRNKDKEQFNIALKEQERACSILNQEIDRLTIVINKIKDDNLLLADYTKQLEETIVKNQRQHDSIVRKLKCQIEDLYDYGEKTALQKKELLESNQIITKSLQDAKRTEVHLKDSNQTLYKQNKKIFSQVRQLQNELIISKEKRKTLEEAIDRQSKNFQTNASKLIEQNTLLARQIKETENKYNTTLIEHKEATQNKNDLHSTINKLNGQLKLLENEYVDCQSRLGQEKSRNNQQQIEITKLNQVSNTLKSQYSYLQSLNGRLKKEVQILTQERMRLLKNGEPNDLNKDLMNQINKMMIAFKEERQNAVKMGKIEKQKLIETYEYQLREKDVSYMKEIANLRDQINLNQQFDALIEKNNNIYTKASFKY